MRGAEEADQRRGDHREDDLLEDAIDLERAGPGGDQRRTEQPADQRVAARAGQAVVPGEQVPDDGADQRGADHALRCSSSRRPARRRSSWPRPSPAKAPMKLNAVGHQDRGARLEGARRDGRRDRVGRVVEAVDVVEDTSASTMTTTRAPVTCSICSPSVPAEDAQAALTRSSSDAPTGIARRRHGRLARLATRCSPAPGARPRPPLSAEPAARRPARRPRTPSP